MSEMDDKYKSKQTRFVNNQAEEIERLTKDVTAGDYDNVDEQHMLNLCEKAEMLFLTIQGRL